MRKYLISEQDWLSPEAEARQKIEVALRRELHSSSRRVYHPKQGVLGRPERNYLELGHGQEEGRHLRKLSGFPSSPEKKFPSTQTRSKRQDQ
tara:strand:- start:1380 stop:1655 length:276 start_codon:yes stop_codon:yes gene_type:complete